MKQKLAGLVLCQVSVFFCRSMSNFTFISDGCLLRISSPFPALCSLLLSCSVAASFQSSLQCLLGFCMPSYLYIDILSHDHVAEYWSFLLYTVFRNSLSVLVTCEASRFDSSSNRTSDSGLDSY